MGDNYFVSKKAKYLFIIFFTSGRIRRDLLGINYCTYLTLASAKQWYDSILAVLEQPNSVSEFECDSPAMLAAKQQLNKACEEEGVYNLDDIKLAKAHLKDIYKNEVLPHYQLSVSKD